MQQSHGVASACKDGRCSGCVSACLCAVISPVLEMAARSVLFFLCVSLDELVSHLPSSLPPSISPNPLSSMLLCAFFLSHFLMLLTCFGTPSLALHPQSLALPIILLLLQCDLFVQRKAARYKCCKRIPVSSIKD